MLVDSSLFRTCKQTRAEGLSLFYQHHIFMLSALHMDCCKAILRWLQNIGSVGRDNIRHLIVRFRGKCNMMHKRLMDHINETLTEKATVVYIGKPAGLLWILGRHFIHGDPAIAPVYMVDGKALEPNCWNINSDYGKHLYNNKRSTEYSIAFYPGQGWFGSRLSRAQAST